MQVQVSSDAAPSVSAGAIVVPVFLGGALDGVAAQVDAVLGGELADALSAGEITGKLNEVVLIHAKDTPFKRVLAVGLGERSKMTAGSMAKYAGTAVRYLGKRGVKHIAIALPEGVIAEGLGAIQAKYPQIDLGSYPFYRPSGNGVALVAKGADVAAAEAAIAEVTALITGFGKVPIPGEPEG